MNGVKPRLPGFMYVYHLAHEEHPPTDTPSRTVHNKPEGVYLFQLKSDDDVRSALPEAVRLIIDHKVQPLPVLPDTDGIEWRVESYAVFVLISATEKLVGVEFSADGKKHEEGFYEVCRIEGRSDWTAFIFHNKRVRHNGGTLGNGDELVRWDAHHLPRSGSAAERRGHNSSDTNVGP